MVTTFKIERSRCDVHTGDLVSLFRERDHQMFCAHGVEKYIWEGELGRYNVGALADFDMSAEGVWKLKWS